MECYNTMLVKLLLLCFSVKHVTSIFCYDCNSEFDPRCGAEFDPFSLGTVNCSLKDQPDHIEPMEPTFCRSIRMDIFGKIRVVRTCGYLRDNETTAPCRRVVGTGDVFTTYCQCDTDLCNAGTSHGVAEMALFAIIVTAMVF